jgi:hypothetical protein
MRQARHHTRRNFMAARCRQCHQIVNVAKDQQMVVDMRFCPRSQLLPPISDVNPSLFEPPQQRHRIRNVEQVVS